MTWFVFPMIKRIIIFLFLPLCLITQYALANEATNDFEVKKIIIEGNERISFETIHSHLTVNVGDTLTANLAATSIKRLYQTRFFKNISLYQQTGGILTIVVLERPSIADISMVGNKLIATENLEAALSLLGIKKGRIFNENQLERVVVDLRRQYQNQGYYAAEIAIIVEELPRNRVALTINVEEGEPAKIARITLIGNKTYTDERLKNLLQLSDSSFGSPDRYSKPLLQADKETIKTYYMDRGFVEFEHKSSQVSLSRDKTEVFITINFKEGPQYTISEIKFSGETILSKQELINLQEIVAGDLFSRSKIVATVDNIQDSLSDVGFAFAQIDPKIQLDKDAHTAIVDFRIEPKKRVYVRRIMIEGNTRTKDHVIRRELRQLESAPYSLQNIQRSNTRLNRLGFFRTARIETKRVADDLVDLVINVEEQSTGAFNAGLGYSQLDGLNFTLGVSERNVIGSGYRANINASYSAAMRVLDLGVTNPYFTNDGVSLGGGIYFREIDAAELGTADFTTNNHGIRINIGYPTNEWSSLNFGLKLDDQTIMCNEAFLACNAFVANNGTRFSSARLSVGWAHDTRNAFFFPTQGRRVAINTEIVVPINSDTHFYKVFLNESRFIPLTKNFTLKLKAGIAYGDGFNNTQEMPFYENFFTGGIGSVRGYSPNSLGPVYNLATDGSSRPKGGSVRTVYNAEIIFPMPFVGDSDNLRLSLFVDAGNVFEGIEDVNVTELRASTGLGISWITPVGPLSFSFSRPLNAKDTDQTQVFQFNLGVPF